MNISSGNNTNTIGTQTQTNGIPIFNGQASLVQPEPDHARSKAVGVPLTLYRDVYEQAENRALESGVLEVREQDLTPIVESALAMAEETYRDLFNPGVHDADQLREQEFQKALNDRNEAEVKEKHAAAALKEEEEALARMPRSAAPSPPPLALKIAAVVLIALTVAVTLHDLVFLFADDVTAWAMSFAVGALCAWFVVSLVLYNVGSEHAATEKNWFGLIAGVLIGLGFLIVRLEQVSDTSGLLFAIGMTVLEIGAVLGLHGTARRYEKALSQWREQVRPVVEKASRRDAAKAHFELCRKERQDLDVAVNDHVQYVEERHLRNKLQGELKGLLEKTVRDGYAAGVAKNVGRVRGVRKGETK